MLLPCNLIDFIVKKTFEFKVPKIGEGMLYWLKSAHRQNLIEYKNHDGLMLWLNPHNYIDRILLSGKTHDIHVLEAIKKNTQDSDVFWDIGANIGYIGLSLLRMKPNCSVVAFEPSPFSLVQLFMNNELNGNKIKIFPFALSNVDGIQEFSLKINRNSGQSTLLPEKKFSYDCSLKVQTKIADELVRDGLIPMPHVIKIDVEGAEFMVLSGMKNILASEKLRAVIFESPSDCDSNVIKLLESYGFNSIIRLNNKAQTDFLASKKT
jgi:FkbM family methyltransferase